MNGKLGCSPRGRAVGVALALSVVLGGYVAGPLSLPAASAAELHVFAASSLTEAFSELGKTFEAEHLNCAVAFNFAGSQLLRTQIEQGAPADVFASADAAQMEPLVRARLVSPQRVFAHNDLVVAASTRSGKVETLGDLALPGIRVVVAGGTVPVGRYTTQVLEAMDASRAYGDEFLTQVTANVRSQETNVRAVLAKVVLGEADAGIVYRTDVRGAEGIAVLDIPEHVNVIAAYPIATIRGAASGVLAEAFVQLVTSERGQKVLAAHGFRP